MKDKKVDLKTPNSSQGENGKLPEESIYEKPVKPNKIMDKTGWTVREENQMIMNGDLSPLKSGDELIPFGFEQPRKNTPTGRM